MSDCKKKTYISNAVVYLSRPLVCYGGYKQPVCEHLEDCLKENGYYIHVTRSGRQRIRKGKI